MDSADLHVHSTISDGLLSPAEIIHWAVRKGVKAISLTDHDSLGGIEQAVMHGKENNIDVIPGIELSTEYNGVEVHMLGYLLNYHDFKINSFLKELEQNRIERTKNMVIKLNRLGIIISFEDILKVAKNAASIGRPHVARAVVNAGYAGTIGEVFEKYISIGKPAFVERYKISPFQALNIIIESGGVASIAHPGLINNIDKLKLIRKLKDWGLTGIEVYHSKHSAQDVAVFNSFAAMLDLIPTGGTDCHGEMINGSPMLGDVTVPYENVERLIEAQTKTTHNN